jgi:hypothetical protein
MRLNERTGRILVFQHFSISRDAIRCSSPFLIA